MKNFRDYLSESEEAADKPVAGDTFAINIREECLIESVVVESRDDGVVIAADEGMMRLLESYGYTFEENCMECGMMECGCGQDPEEYGDETDAGQDPGEYDHEGSMAKDELATMIRSARKLIGMLDNDDNMPEWTQKKINKATDYVDTASDYISSQKERGVMEQSEETSPVASAVLHRIMMQHPGVLAQHGPEKVMDAVDELADYVNIGPDDEIGSSDVSGWVRDVIRMLAELPDEPMDVGDALDEQDMATGSKSELDNILSHYAKEVDHFRQGGDLDYDLESALWEYHFNRGDIRNYDADASEYIAQQLADELGLTEAEYQGRKVPLGKPMKGDVKKSKVYVKNPQGNVVKVNFGDPNMKIKKSNPARRKSFRARHNCDNPGPRTSARYWSCRAW